MSSELIDIQVRDFKKQYKNYKEYIEGENWVDDFDPANSYKTESVIISNIIKDLGNFKSENESYLHLAKVRDFLHYASDIIKIHTDRIERYLEENSWNTKYTEEKARCEAEIKRLEKEGLDEVNKIQHQDLITTLEDIEAAKREEIRFQNELFTKKVSIRVDTIKLNLTADEATNTSVHLFHADRKASLIMKDSILVNEPYAKERYDTLPLIFPTNNICTSKELFINMNPKDIPPYDPKRHFFEQPLSTIQFWENEIYKIKHGVNLGGYELSSFLYFLSNFAKVSQGSDLEKDVINAHLRDNEYYFDASVKEAIDGGYEALLQYGTRRFGKSFIEALYLLHGNLIITSCTSNLIALSEKDLSELTNYIFSIVKYLPPALQPNIDISSDKEIIFGVKKTAQTRYDMSRIDIVNIEGKNKKSKSASEKPAGGTPDRVVIDEALHEDEVVVTNSGFKKIKDVVVGEKIFDPSGEETCVVDKIDVGQRQLYEITLHNGVKIKACGNHLWEVKSDFNYGKVGVKTTDELIKDYRIFKYSLRKTQPVGFKERQVTVDPYLLGVTIDHTTVPVDDYILNSIEVRLQLLRGIMDEYGIIDDDICTIPGKRKETVNNIQTLLESLGINTKIEIDGNGLYTISFSTSSDEQEWMPIVNIVPAEVNQAYCIKVSNDSKLFLTTMFTTTHNCGKGDALTPYLSLRPALAGGTDGKPRALVVMSGTPGNEELSASAEKMLTNCKAYGILPINMDLLEKISDPESVTWKKSSFSTFVPAQMSLFVPKIKTNMAEFLGVDNKQLKDVEFYKTDWKRGKEFFEQRRRDSDGDNTALAKEIAYHPLDPEDVFMSGETNPFDEISIKKFRQRLISSGDVGKSVNLYMTEANRVAYELSDKAPVSQYPWSGGAVDAPVVLYEELDEGYEPPFGLFVMGLDDVKHDTSDGDSLFSVTVYRRNLELSEWSGRIVATYTTRPMKKDEAYKQAYYLMKYYNAIVFPENDDEGWKNFIERRYKMDAIKHLAEGADFSNSLDFHYNRHRRIGFSTSGRNVPKLNSRVLSYTQEAVEGNEQQDGYTRIPDIMLLQEMISYKKGRNADRLRSFGLCLLYADYLDKTNSYLLTKRRKLSEEEYKTHVPIKKRSSLSSGKRKNQRRTF